MSNPIERKPCPWCGSTRIMSHLYTAVIVCGNCGHHALQTRDGRAVYDTTLTYTLREENKP